jgi:Leucine-rich repeat (LRR) protein
MKTYQFEEEYLPSINELILRYVTPEVLRNYIYPPDLEILTIVGDYLDEFRIPEGVKRANLENLALKKVYVPDSIEVLYVDNNKLKSLEVPQTIVDLEAQNNILQDLVFRGGEPRKLSKLIVSNNRLQKLDFPVTKKLMAVDIEGNDDLETGCSEELKKFILSSDQSVWVFP